MSFLYTFGIALYTLFIRFAAFFNSKARKWVHGRKGWKRKLSKAFSEGDKIAWFHAASLGEFEQGRPVMEAFRKHYPDYKILLTFFSPSGYEQKKNFEGADAVMYLPADCRANTRYFVSALKPAIAIFIKYEFWYNYLAELNRQKIPTVFISAHIKGNEPFFKWYGSWFRKILRRVDHFFVQDQASALLLQQTGISNITVSGDTRFDRVADILEDKREYPDIEKFCEGHQLLLAGSTWPPDEEVLAGLPGKYPDLKLIIAPHEVNEERVKQLINTLNIDVALYTKDDSSTWKDKQVLILDTIGVLSSIYRYADVAYIGGGFGSGLHNIQEPAVNAIPVVFGPKYNNFREATDLVKQEGAFSIQSPEEMNKVLSVLLTDAQKYQFAASRCRAYMMENTGATEKIMDGLQTYL